MNKYINITLINKQTHIHTQKVKKPKKNSDTVMITATVDDHDDDVNMAKSSDALYLMK